MAPSRLPFDVWAFSRSLAPNCSDFSPRDLPAKRRQPSFAATRPQMTIVGRHSPIYSQFDAKGCHWGTVRVSCLRGLILVAIKLSSPTEAFGLADIRIQILRYIFLNNIFCTKVLYSPALALMPGYAVFQNSLGVSHRIAADFQLGLLFAVSLSHDWIMELRRKGSCYCTE